MATVKNRARRSTPPQAGKGLRLGVVVGGLVLVVLVGLGTYGFLRRSVPESAPSEAAGTVAVQPDVAPQALPKNHIYSETDDPRAEIVAAVTAAKREHKRVLLDFGGDWCGDCQVLDLYLHQAPNGELLTKNFVLVHVFIGQLDKNLDVPARYGVPVAKGVPALAVLDGTGKLIYAQQTGEFERMRHMDPATVTEFLNRWKA